MLRLARLNRRDRERLKQCRPGDSVTYLTTSEDFLPERVIGVIEWISQDIFYVRVVSVAGRVPPIAHCIWVNLDHIDFGSFRRYTLPRVVRLKCDVEPATETIVKGA